MENTPLHPSRVRGRVSLALGYLQALDHGDDLHQGKLLLAGVVVACGSLVLLCRAGTVFVAELIRRVDQLPRVLGGGGGEQNRVRVKHGKTRGKTRRYW